MDKKQTKPLTEFEKKFVELEVKKTKQLNQYLATTKMKVTTYKKPGTKKGGENNGKI